MGWPWYGCAEQPPCHQIRKLCSLQKVFCKSSSRVICHTNENICWARNREKRWSDAVALSENELGEEDFFRLSEIKDAKELVSLIEEMCSNEYNKKISYYLNFYISKVPALGAALQVALGNKSRSYLAYWGVVHLMLEVSSSLSMTLPEVLVWSWPSFEYKSWQLGLKSCFHGLPRCGLMLPIISMRLRPIAPSLSKTPIWEKSCLKCYWSFSPRQLQLWG